MFGWTSWALLSRARKAARALDWLTAADAYRAYLARRPDQGAAWVQLGHACKERGDFSGARIAYERAVKLNANSADGWLQLGHILKLQGDRPTAIEAYASAAALDPSLPPAAEELVSMGARDRLPLTSVIHDSDGPVAMFGHGDLESAMNAALDEVRRPGTVPPSQYDLWRRQLTIPRPPAGQGAGPLIEILLDGRTAIAADVRATLSSLLDQVHEHWRVTVLAPAPMRDHSVASLALLDERVVFVEPRSVTDSALSEGLKLLVEAGVVLDRQALAWLAFAARRTGCAAAYGDHDRGVDSWPQGRRFDTPALQPMFDPIWFANPETTPALVLVDGSRVATPRGDASAATRRRALFDAAEVGGVAHLPMLLSCVKALPSLAEAAMADPEPAVTAPSSPPIVEPDSSSEAGSDRIQVIIQTRDEPDLLEACVSSLRARAARPGLLDISIVDNRSVLEATHRLLAKHRREGVDVIPLDAPFNWSHANNLAAEGGVAPILLFLNNDTEMLTQAWDERLREALASPQVGIVGALLFYPDRTIQHAGMIFGMGVGGPVHEGVGKSSEDAGSLGRWALPRLASAVTGAFMAMRRTVFEQIGRFDAAAFSIAFNDVDICLRARAAGFGVLQTPKLTLVHHESKTRGMNVTRSRIAWDLEELALMHRRWGAALFSDPGYNPHWTRYGQPFDGYRFPALREVVRHIDFSARPRPWTPRHAEGADLDWW